MAAIEGRKTHTRAVGQWPPSTRKGGQKTGRDEKGHAPRQRARPFSRAGSPRAGRPSESIPKVYRCFRDRGPLTRHVEERANHAVAFARRLRARHVAGSRDRAFGDPLRQAPSVTSGARKGASLQTPAQAVFGVSSSDRLNGSVPFGADSGNAVIVGLNRPRVGPACGEYGFSWY